MTCPICHKDLPAGADRDSPLFPFCSRRCKEVDLFRWTEGRYAVVEPLTIERLIEATGDVDLDDQAPP
jgi:endogenous inhibitor of DNA gyrase (YacG/DUF329 family)